MAEIFSQFDTPLTSIPGIGPLLGAVILSEIRDISSSPLRISCSPMQA